MALAPNGAVVTVVRLARTCLPSNAPIRSQAAVSQHMPDFPLIADAGAALDLWHWIVELWLFAIGASIGSFLNVVVYRLPAGLSIVHPPSHCPACKHPIRPYDNIPIVSYVLLRGRCRDCGARFSPRYALVELGAGLVLVAVAATGPLFRYGSLAELLDDGAAMAWGELAFLAVLLASLWSAALIARDGKLPQWRLLVAPLVVGLACGMTWPQLYANPASAMLDAWPARALISPALTGPLGACVGAALVVLWQAIAARRDDKALAAPCPKSWNIAWAAVAGLFLGWQLTLAAVAFSAAMMAFSAVATPGEKTVGPRIGVAWLSRFALAATLAVVIRNGWPSIALLYPRAWAPVAFAVIVLGAIVVAMHLRLAAQRRA